MPVFRNVYRILSHPSLLERSYGAILCKLRAVITDAEAPPLQKNLALSLFMERTPQLYVDSVVRAIASTPELHALIVVTDEGSSYNINSDAVTDDQISAVVASCWGALIAQKTAQ